MRFKLFVAAAVALSASLAAHADTLNYTLIGPNEVATFSLDQNPQVTAVFSLGFQTTAVTIDVNGKNETGVIQFELPTSTDGGCQFAFVADFSPCDFSANNVYFSGDPSAPTLLTGTFMFDDADGDGLFTLRVSDASTTPVSATPEPSSVALLGTGLLGVAGMMKRRFA